MQDESLNLPTLWGIKLSEKQGSNFNTIGKLREASTASNGESNSIVGVGKIDLTLNLFELPVNEVSVNVIPKTTVIPLGNSIGLKLYTEGVLIVGMTEIEGQKPYENTGLKEGDRIISINNTQIFSTEDLVETVNSSKGKEITIKYIRDDTEETTNMVPVKTKENEYKLGLWVRDAAAGVGTATFYVPSTGMFLSLIHI